MNNQPDFDVAQAHRFFSADCYNRTWAYLDKPDRSPEDEEQMRSLAHTSLWHWTQRTDCTTRNLSIACWLLSRVYAVLDHSDEAMGYATTCLDHSRGEPPFYRAYAFEALARAAMVGSRRTEMDDFLSQARLHAAAVEDPEVKMNVSVSTVTLHQADTLQSLVGRLT